MKNKIELYGIDMSVNVNGRPVSTYLHEGKYFIESRTNTEYSIEIKNNNSYRVEAVVSVDGLSVISGKSATTEERGYIISAWSNLTIKGFRKDNETVGAFKFTEKEKSYAASKGLETNVGVIAIAIFKEKVKVDPVPQVIYKDIHHYYDHEEWPTWPGLPKYPPYKPWKPYYEPTWVLTTCNTSDSPSVNFCSVSNFTPTAAAAKSAEFEHGTTWGSKIADKVTTTLFEREHKIIQQEIFYNSKENLEAIGIKFIQEKQIAYPKGFPSDFATPPIGWVG